MTTYKILNRHIYLFLFFIIWVLLVILQYFDFFNTSVVCQILEFITDSINISLTYIIWRHTMKENAIGFIYLMLSMVLLLLVDVWYFITYSIVHLSQYVYIFDIIHLCWYIFLIIFFLQVTIKYILNKKLVSYLIFIIFLDMLLFKLFSIDTENYWVLSLNNIIFQLQFICELIMYNLAVFWLILSLNTGLSLISSGYTIIMAIGFMYSSSYNSKIYVLLPYAELVWVLGVTIVMFGLLEIIYKNDYAIKKWFLTIKSIRSILTLLVYGVGFVAFIGVFIIILQYAVTSKFLYIFFPTLLVIYSLFVVYLAIAVGIMIESSFKNIQSNISKTFEGHLDNLTTYFKIAEFNQLNKYFIELYTYKTSLEAHIISMATRIAHDIKSPLQIIENLLKNQNNELLLQKAFIKQINKISYISKSLLKENKKIIDDNSYGLQSLYSIIEDLISDKQIEWNTEYSVINFEYNSNQIIWLDNEQAKIKNIISNLLNNSFEARTADSEDIKINLTVNLNNQNIIIYIQDFGSGMSDEILNIIRSGKTLKVNGNGIGVISAEKFMNEINGKFDIKTQLNYGTKIRLDFPKLSFSPQFATEIQLCTNHIVVVDDNSTIINFWQEYFLFSIPRKRVEYFINFRSLSDFLLKNNHNEVTYLIDYHIFGEKITGIDIIKNFNLKNIYLITDSAEDIKLQEEVKLLEVKLIPKTMLNTLLQNK